MPSNLWIIDLKILTQNFQSQIYWRMEANTQGSVSSTFANAKKNEYTINWYSESNARLQANLKDDIYNYIAL